MKDFAKFWQDLENGVIEIEPVADTPKDKGSAWDEQTYFPDYTSNVKNHRVESLQQQRMSEAFEESLKKDRQRRRVLFPVFLIAFILAFCAAIACGVLWIGGVLTPLEGWFWCAVAGAVNYFCMRQVWA